MILGGYEPSEKELRDKQLAALSQSIKTMRDEAVQARAASGIEAEWLEDEEYYEGIDDANRASRMIKPTSPDGRVRIVQNKEVKSSRSTVFVNITRPYVNAAAAKLADMRFPNDSNEIAKLRPTPKPDLIRKSKDNSPAVGPDGQPIGKTMIGEDGQPVLDEQQQPIRAQATNADVAAQEIKEAEAACEKATQQINDWLVECNYIDEARQAIEDSARIGTGVLKGPFPENVRKRAVVQALEGIGMVVKDELLPKTKRISVWNLYPSADCGESIHNGKHLFEYDEINAYQLQNLKRDPSYLANAIEQVITEGPKDHVTGQTKRNKNDKPNDKEMYGIWYFYGFLSKEELETAGYEFEKEPEEEVGLIEESPEETPEEYPEEQDLPEGGSNLCECEEEDENEQFPALVVMVNDTVIKATLQTMDSGEFPYDVICWQRRSGHWAGIGVGRQMRTEQDGANAATRALMDNMGESARPHRIINRAVMSAGPDRWTWYAKEGEDVPDVTKAMEFFNYPSNQAELANVIQFWMQRAEQAVGLPMILQGQTSVNTPDTARGQVIANNNGNTVLRRILWNYEKAAKDHIGRYYEWLLLHVDDDSMKGDFTVEVRDISALIERDMHAQIYMQMLALSKDPAYGKDPELVLNEFLATQRIDATKLELSKEKKEQIANQPPPQDPRIPVAQINAQARSQDKQMELQAKAQADQAQRDFEAQQAGMDRMLEQWIANLDVSMKNAQLTVEQRNMFESLKADFARDAMKLRMQKELAYNVKAPQVATPPSEPPGRAQPGQAFQR